MTRLIQKSTTRKQTYILLLEELLNDYFIPSKRKRKKINYQAKLFENSDIYFTYCETKNSNEILLLEYYLNPFCYQQN